MRIRYFMKARLDVVLKVIRNVVISLWRPNLNPIEKHVNVKSTVMSEAAPHNEYA